MTPRIVESDGSIFDPGCAALVSPVDAATGAQGKGLALEFKRRWPERCVEYWRRCVAGNMRPGGVMLDESSKPIILFAATKRHWREPSRIEWVRGCLEWIVQWTEVEAATEDGVQSIALPALGCGLGSLSWESVRPLILDAAARMQCERVVVYGPK